MDVATLAGLLREAEEHHGPFEGESPKHHWSGFYAAYVDARASGASEADADAAGRRYIEQELAAQATGP